MRRVRAATPATRCHSNAKGGTAVASAYALLSRTLLYPGLREEFVPALEDVAFLIDRFAYLRARWLPGDDQERWSAQQLGHMQQALADQAQIRAAPELHLHWSLARHVTNRDFKRSC